MILPPPHIMLLSSRQQSLGLLPWLLLDRKPYLVAGISDAGPRPSIGTPAFMGMGGWSRDSPDLGI